MPPRLNWEIPKVWNGEGGLCQTSQMEARQQEEGADLETSPLKRNAAIETPKFTLFEK